MKLLDQIRHIARLKHYPYLTEQTCAYRAEKYIRYHHIRHPNTMGAAEVEQFLTRLAADRRVSASTQNQAPNAPVFLYRDVLRIDPGRVDALRPSAAGGPRPCCPARRSGSSWPRRTACRRPSRTP